MPEEKIHHSFPEKTDRLASIVPGNIQTYIYNTEIDYYNGYRKSYFGLTCRKAGWDCLRHYEILANRCIPYFYDLNVCPDLTMCQFPKDTIKKTNQMFDSESPLAGTALEDQYLDYENDLYEYTKKNLTTKALISYILNH